MKKIRVIIVDDEELARQRLRQLLKSHAEAQIVAECADGLSAVDAIRESQPDLVFLDVQMPELDGFGVLEQLDAGQRPAIVFVTAHDRFALKAFEVHAIDYLLKPFDKERFEKAYERALARVENAGELPDKLAKLVEDLKSQPRKSDRLVVKTDGRMIFVRMDDLDWVEAADNYVNLHIGTESHLLRETLTALEGRLPGAKFMRISRSTIVNVDKIKELQPLFHGDYVVILRNGTKLTLSRSYREKLDQLLGKM